MAEEKHPVKAATFKQTGKKNYEMDIKNEKKFTRMVPKELKFFYSTPNPNGNSFNLKESNRRTIKPSRMLIYEDCSEDDEPSRSTPPNIQDRSTGTPGAPIKSRKEFDKKVLRPKKLVYNDKDKENDNDGDLSEKNQFYHSTPKKSEKKEENGDFYFEKLTNITATIPRKILPIRDDDSLSVYSTNRQFIAASSSVRSQDRSNSRNEGSRKKKLNNGARKTSSRSTISKDDSTCNKENNAAQLVVENDQEGGEFKSESCGNRIVKNDRNREEFMNLSKIGELTHFRI